MGRQVKKYEASCKVGHVLDKDFQFSINGSVCKNIQHQEFVDNKKFPMSLYTWENQRKWFMKIIANVSKARFRLIDLELWF